MAEKLRTDISVNSGLTGETRVSVALEKLIPRKKINIKSLDTSSEIKYPITNQDKNALWLQKYQCLSPHLPLFPSGFKALRNKSNYDNPETTDTSRTDKDDTSHTNQDDSIENVKYMKNINDDEKYKEDNSQHQDGN